MKVTCMKSVMINKDLYQNNNNEDEIVDDERVLQIVRGVIC